MKGPSTLEVGVLEVTVLDGPIQPLRASSSIEALFGETSPSNSQSISSSYMRLKKLLIMVFS